MARVRGFGELEASTMDRLWDRDSDATVRDTFADLRSENQTKEEVLKNTCFICGT